MSLEILTELDCHWFCASLIQSTLPRTEWSLCCREARCSFAHFILSALCETWGRISCTKKIEITWLLVWKKLHRASGRHFSAKLVPFLAGRGMSRVRATDIHGNYSRFSKSEPLLFIQVAPQLSSGGWMVPIPDPPLPRKSGRAGNRTRDLWICNNDLWLVENRGGQETPIYLFICLIIFAGLENWD
jgi:hypothetical protein